MISKLSQVHLSNYEIRSIQENTTDFLIKGARGLHELSRHSDEQFEENKNQHRAQMCSVSKIILPEIVRFFTS